MIYALLTGRGGSKGIKNKNTVPVLGRPLMVYPLLSAKNSKYIRETYLTTDSEAIASIGRQYGAKIIWRPAHLATDTALNDDVIVHAYKYMNAELSLNVEILAIFLCNTATITPGIIDQGIEILISDESIDSCVTVSEYSEYSPPRALLIDNGLLKPVVDLTQFKGATGDRSSVGNVYFLDGVYICRARCMNLNGILVNRCAGRKIVPLIQEDGLDVDDERGLVTTEWWLRKHGFTETKTPYD